jgi:hypothetical protein
VLPHRCPLNIVKKLTMFQVSSTVLHVACQASRAVCCIPRSYAMNVVKQQLVHFTARTTVIRMKHIIDRIDIEYGP